MTICIPEDESVPCLKKGDSPIAKKAWEYLQMRGLVRAGMTIDAEHVERAIGKKYEKDSWAFLGPYILLKNKIESEGYFITQRELDPPAFRILSSEEMAEHAYKKLMHNLANNYKIAYTLAAHDTSSMTDSSKKKHKVVQNQAAQTALLQQKMLIDSNYF